MTPPPSPSPTLPVRAIAPDVFVAAQLAPAAMAEVARAGFRSIVNNRPDFEGGPEQPSSRELQAAAEAAGLVYHHVPVPSAAHSPQDIAALARLLPSLPRPLLMFCRSGARSARLFEGAQCG